MARTSIKSTYALDVETVRALERTAARWKVSKSEALRRMIRLAAEQPEGSNEALSALDELQQALRLTPAKARSWAQEVRGERRAASARSERRG